MNHARDLETRPRPFPQVATVCVPGHGTAATCDVRLAAAMCAEVIRAAR